MVWSRQKVAVSLSRSAPIPNISFWYVCPVRIVQFYIFCVGTAMFSVSWNSNPEIGLFLYSLSLDSKTHTYIKKTHQSVKGILYLIDSISFWNRSSQHDLSVHSLLSSLNNEYILFFSQHVLNLRKSKERSNCVVWGHCFLLYYHPYFMESANYFADIPNKEVVNQWMKTKNNQEMENCNFIPQFGIGYLKKMSGGIIEKNYKG